MIESLNSTQLNSRFIDIDKHLLKLGPSSDISVKKILNKIINKKNFERKWGGYTFLNGVSYQQLGQAYTRCSNGGSPKGGHCLPKEFLGGFILNRPGRNFRGFLMESLNSR